MSWHRTSFVFVYAWLCIFHANVDHFLSGPACEFQGGISVRTLFVDNFTCFLAFFFGSTYLSSRVIFIAKKLTLLHQNKFIFPQSLPCIHLLSQTHHLFCIHAYQHLVKFILQYFILQIMMIVTVSSLWYVANQQVWLLILPWKHLWSCLVPATSWAQITYQRWTPESRSWSANALKYQSEFY